MYNSAHDATVTQITCCTALSGAYNKDLSYIIYLARVRGELGANTPQPAFTLLGTPRKRGKASRIVVFTTLFKNCRAYCTTKLNNGSDTLIRLNRRFNSCLTSLFDFLAKTFDLDRMKLDEYTRFAQWCVKHHGLKHTVKILKDLNNMVRRICLNQHVDDKTLGGIWFDCFKSGVPRSLPYLNYLVENHQQAAICVVNAYVSFRISPEIDLRTLEDEGKGALEKEDINHISDWIKDNYPKEEVKLITPSTDNPVYTKDLTKFSLKAGPNHKVALLGAPLDCLAIHHNSDYETKFLLACDLLGMVHLKSRYLNLVSECTKSKDLCNKDHKDLHLAKLVFLSNPGGKTRIVYILNWFSQNLLYPLHNSMMIWLRNQKQDATFTQRAAALTVKGWTAAGMKTWSFDLSAATDRWPRIHQKAIISSIWGENWADVWLDTMEIKPYVPDLGRYTKYSVGQPMGAYASWAALAVSHHITIRYLAAQMGLSDPKYVVLGDDVVIAESHDLALAYEKYMVELLGVQISKAKSFAYENQISGSSAEFGKAIFLNGKEFTPISPVLLSEVIKDHQWFKMIQVLKWCRNVFQYQVTVSDGYANLPTLYDNILNLLSKEEKEKLLIVLTSDSIREELTPLDPVACDSIAVLNPWKGADGDKLSLLYLKGDLVNNKLSEMFLALNKLKSDLKGVAVDKLPDPSLRLEYHPIWELLKDLEDATLSIARCIANGDHPADAVNLLTDMRLLRILLIEQKPLSVWDRSNSDALRKDKEHMLISLHKTWKGNPIEDISPDQFDW